MIASLYLNGTLSSGASTTRMTQKLEHVFLLRLLASSMITISC